MSEPTNNGAECPICKEPHEFADPLTAHGYVKSSLYGGVAHHTGDNAHSCCIHDPNVRCCDNLALAPQQTQESGWFAVSDRMPKPHFGPQIREYVVRCSDGRYRAATMHHLSDRWTFYSRSWRPLDVTHWCELPSFEHPRDGGGEIEHLTICDGWTISFNSFSAGMTWRDKHPNATDEEVAEACEKYAMDIFPHEVCEDGEPFTGKGALERDACKEER